MVPDICLDGEFTKRVPPIGLHVKCSIDTAQDGFLIPAVKFAEELQVSV